MISPIEIEGRPPRRLCVQWLAAGVLSVTASAQAVVMELSGVQPREGYNDLHPLPDVDGDGVLDFMVTSFATLDGYAAILSGATFMRIGTGSWDVVSPSASRPVPDVDGDGVPDVVTGADSIVNQVRYYNALTGATIATRNIPTGFYFLPAATTPLDDVDVDGYADFAFTSPFGDVAIVSGRTLDVVRFHLIGAQFTNGSVQGKVAACGDVNGNGSSDYALAFWLGNHVPVIDGLTGAEIRRYSGGALSPPFAPQLEGFGTTVANVGDIDGDGAVDLLVASNRQYTQLLTGQNANDPSRLYGISGATGAVLWRLEGLPLSGGVLAHEFYSGAWGGGDVDADGFMDVLTSTSIRSGRDGSLLWRFIANDPQDPLHLYQASGYVPMRLLRDVNGDGIDDWIMGGAFANGLRGEILIMGGASVRRAVVCAGSTNGFGNEALLEWSGPLAIGRSHTEVVVSNALPLSPGLVFVGQPLLPPPGSQAWLCVGAPAQRLGAPLSCNALGTLTLRIDWTQPWAQALAPGVTHHIQTVYRNPTAVTGLATSSALQLVLSP